MAQRTILTPILDLASVPQGRGRSYWKKVLPNGRIHYTDADGKTSLINFDRGYHDDLIAAYTDGALDQTPLQLADADNRHTMDPERYRADVTKMCRWEDLPADVQATFGDEGGPGLYTKIKFANDDDAQAVMRNPKLGVSARIREGYKNAVTGKTYKRAMIHVLGTLDPKVSKLGAWKPAMDLSRYDSGDVLDLSHSTLEAPVAKKTGDKNNRTFDFASVATADIVTLTEAEIEAMTEADVDELTNENLSAFVARCVELGLVPAETIDEPPTGTPPAVTEPPTGQTQETTLSNIPPEAQRQIDLANASAADAIARVSRAEAVQADATWRAYRNEQIGMGVPPAVLDLSEPVLHRPTDMVIDLSNEGGSADVALGQIVRDLVEGYQGTIPPLDVELGHGGQTEDDPDAALAEAYEEMFPVS